MKKTVFALCCLSIFIFTSTPAAFAQDPADPHAAHAAQATEPAQVASPAPADPHAAHAAAPAPVLAPAKKASKPAKAAKKPVKASKKKPTTKPATKEAVTAPAKQEPGCGMMKMDKPKAAQAEPGAATPAAGMKHDMKKMKSKMAPAEPGPATPVSDPKAALPATLPSAHVH